MNRKPLLRRALVWGALAACSGLSQASLSFSWTLPDGSPTVTSTESFLLHAQIYNEAHSSETLRGNRLLSHAGEGFAFVFGRLRPADGSRGGQAVPEPATPALLLMAAGGGWLERRRNRR